MTLSNLDAIVEGIAAQLRTIPALKVVYSYFPDQIGPYPMVYLDVEGLETPPGPFGAMTMDWTIAAYLITAPIAASASSAATIARLILPQIADVLGHDMDAHASLVSPDHKTRDGLMQIRRISPPGYATIGGQVYYARRLAIQAIEMFTYEYSE